MLRRDAARWLARLQSDDPGARHAFRRWHDADPAHAAAFDRVSRSYEQAGLLRQSPIATERSLEPRPAPAPAQPRFALAAVIACVLLIPAGLFLLKQVGAPPFEKQEALLLNTGVGEIRNVTLDDGTKVTLDTQSAVRVLLGDAQRRAIVERGRARFRIARDRRPFVVAAGAAEIKTAQAVFDVDLAPQARLVKMMSGSAVIVSRDPRQERAGPISLQAGEVFGMKGGITSAPNAAAKGGDWTDGMLQFDGAPLAEVATEANRYSTRRIIVRDPAVAALRVTGAFRAGDTARLARALAETLGLSVERTSEGDFLLSPSAGKKKVG